MNGVGQPFKECVDVVLKSIKWRHKYNTQHPEIFNSDTNKFVNHKTVSNASNPSM